MATDVAHAGACEFCGLVYKHVAPLALGNPSLQPKSPTCPSDAGVLHSVIMLIVPQDVHGDAQKWGREIEVESLEAFALDRNKKIVQLAR
ncbi:MAG: hypothetical protein V9H26_27625 [Verrucomicrobiota bacterium]